MPIDRSLLLPFSKSGKFSTTGVEHYGEGYFLSGTVCYDEETEVLTEEGWKRFPRLSTIDKVCTLNKQGKIEYQLPSNYYEHIINSDSLVRVKTVLIDLLVTRNHKLYVRIIKNHSQKRSEFPFELIEANRLLSEVRETTFKKNGVWRGCEKKFFSLPSVKGKNTKQYEKHRMDDWIEFLGYWLTEGSCRKHYLKTQKHYAYEVGIAQSETKNKKKYEKIKDCLMRLGYKFYASDRGFFISNKQLWNYCSRFGKARTKYIPRKLLSLPVRQLKILWEALMLGDGYKGRYKQCFYTTSKRLADDFQELTLKIGLSANLYYRPNREVYNVSIITRKNNPRVTRLQTSLEPYSGTVYCCQVPNHIIYVRRNGKPCWSGNSGYAGYNSSAFPMDSDARLYKERYKPRKVLDCGCATGILVHAFRKIGVDAWGIDISEWAINHPDHPDVAPYIQVGDIRDLPYEDDEFDLVMSLQTIEHIPEVPVKSPWVKWNMLDRYPFLPIDTFCEKDVIGINPLTELELAWLEMFRVCSKYIALATPEQDTDNKERTHYTIKKVDGWNEYVEHLGGRRVWDCNLPLCSYTKIKEYSPAELSQNPELKSE